jgi:hypothetical protein
MPDQNFEPSLSQTLITGVYRSGTEYFAQCISGHPHLATSMYHVNMLMWTFGRFDPIDDPGNLRKAIDAIEVRNRIRYEFEIDADLVFERCLAAPRITYGVLYDVMMTTLWLGGERRHWAEKCQLLWREIPMFLEMVPNARAIIVLRDPRSILASFKKFTFMPPPTYLGAAFNTLDCMQHIKRFEAELPSDRFLWIRYEDLVQAPAKTASRVYRFLGLDPSLAGFDPSSWTLSSKPWEFNSVFHDDNSAFNVGASIKRWAGNLDEDEIAFCEFVCGEMMTEFGYDLSGIQLDWPCILRRFINDDQITGWFREFLNTGEGVQAWPLDPTKEENWPEVRETRTLQRAKGEKLEILDLDAIKGRISAGRSLDGTD